MKKEKQKENKVFISKFAFDELRKLFEKQKAEIHYLRNCLKFYKEELQQA